MAADGTAGRVPALHGALILRLERLGRWAFETVAEFGFAAALFAESVFWLVVGRRRRQPVRLPSVAQEMMQVGVLALPIVTVLSATIGVMLAIQGIYTLRLFGAESRVTIGICAAVMPLG